MKWTERVMEMKANGRATKQDKSDADDPKTCLVGEAAQLFGFDYCAMSRRLKKETGIDIIGGSLPCYIEWGQWDDALNLCLAVEDAVLRLKREGGNDVR